MVALKVIEATWPINSEAILNTMNALPLCISLGETPPGGPSLRSVELDFLFGVCRLAEPIKYSYALPLTIALIGAGVTLLLHLALYFTGGGIYTLIARTLPESRISLRRFNPLPVAANQVRSEVVAALTTIVVYSFVGSALFLLMFYEVPPFRIATEFLGATHRVILVCGMILLHDTYFYWMHRLLHHPWMFRRIHSKHHNSQTPTVWAAYAFSPIEGFLHGAFLLVAPFVIEVDLTSMVLFLSVQMAFNAWGHCGLAAYLDNFRPYPILNWVNTPGHHNAHHGGCRGNYGLYFRLWDHIMGTECAPWTRRGGDDLGPHDRDMTSPIAKPTTS